MITEIHATCGCGAVRFRSATAPVVQMMCHCKDCQTATGKHHAKAAFFRTRHCDVSGDLRELAFTAKSGSRTTREACAACGTLMFDRSEGFASLIGVMAERIASPFVFEPACHVWIDSRHPDDAIDDALPRYGGNMGG